MAIFKSIKKTTSEMISLRNPYGRRRGRRMGRWWCMRGENKGCLSKQTSVGKRPWEIYPNNLNRLFGIRPWGGKPKNYQYPNPLSHSHTYHSCTSKFKFAPLSSTFVSCRHTIPVGPEVFIFSPGLNLNTFEHNFQQNAPLESFSRWISI